VEPNNLFFLRLGIYIQKLEYGAKLHLSQLFNLKGETNIYTHYMQSEIFQAFIYLRGCKCKWMCCFSESDKRTFGASPILTSVASRCLTFLWVCVWWQSLSHVQVCVSVLCRKKACRMEDYERISLSLSLLPTPTETSPALSLTDCTC